MNTPAQPVSVGNSEDVTPPPPGVPASSAPPKKHEPTKTSLSGVVKIDGKAPAGELGMVTLEPVGAKQRPFPQTRIMEQRNRQFAPRLLVIPIGSMVTFPNFDTTFHNVFSTSDLKAFDLGLYKNGEAREVLFDKEGIIRIGCNLHANMAATIVVVAAPYYTVTDPSGAYNFGSVDPGKYVLKAWNERSATQVSETIEIKPGKNTHNVGVAGDAPAAGVMPDKFGNARGKNP
jgi:plastocyanin